MNERAKHVALMVALWGVVVAAAGILYALAVAQPRPMEAEALQLQARRVRSDALEAQRLALAVATGQLTAHFARQQHADLVRDQQDIRKALDHPPPKDAPGEPARVRDASSSLERLLAEVPANLADAASLRRIAAEEARIAESLKGNASP